MRMTRTSMLAALGLACIPTSGLGQVSSLRLDGRVAVDKLMGDTVTVSLNGAPNRPVFLWIDVSPGPVTLLGRNVPVGFTPSLVAVSLGNTSATGTLSTAFVVPAFYLFHELELFFAAAVIDPAAPFGVDFSNGTSLRFLDRNVQLAGNPLGQFPHFEHATSFNEGTPLSLGIDPTRFPFVAGQSADLYVVASKTKSEWVSDPSLTDVRGAPQAVSFAGGTVQANTITVDPGNLNGDPGGPSLGVGYDLVIDFGKDGNFDDAVDLIDGYTETEAGFYVVRDLTFGATDRRPNQGPLPVSEVLYTGGTFLGQVTYYPTNISTLGQLPLVVISHGNGHNYLWYEHLGYHLASYGFVVMSHENNTMPGSLTAAFSTLNNTDYLLQNLGAIAGGALAGHVDASRIAWLGHSRGGDGVVRAYDMLFDGTFEPDNFGIEDIQLVSAMAPVNFGGVASSNPHDANFHLWVGQSDTDVHGCACLDDLQWYQIHDRATGARQSISLYGVGHDDFHNQNGFGFATGPCQARKSNTHLVMKGYLLPLLKYHLEGEVAAKDYLWRQYDTFRPIGAPTTNCIHVNLMFQEGPSSGKFVVDSFESNPSPTIASSGALVSTTLPSYAEGNLDDNDTVFGSGTSDPFDGFIMHGPGDNSRGAILSADGLGDYDLTYSLETQHRDLSDFSFLQFRAAQGTRHPLTVADLADLTFSVSLEDGNGIQSSINIGAYGGGIEEPYQRNTNPLSCAVCSAGTAGWNSEFETIRVRLADFLNNGNAVDLRDVEKVIFRFGPSWGSAQARLALDEIELSK